MPGSREENFKINNAYSPYDMTTPLDKNPCPGVYEIHNFGRTFYGIHCNILSLSDLCVEEEKKNFKQIMQFQYMT